MATENALGKQKISQMGRPNKKLQFI